MRDVLRRRVARRSSGRRRSAAAAAAAAGEAAWIDGLLLDLEAVRAGVKPALLVEGTDARGDAWAAALAELGANWADVVPLELWSAADADEPAGVALVRRRALAERVAAPAQLWAGRALVDVGPGLASPQPTPRDLQLCGSDALGEAAALLQTALSVDLDNSDVVRLLPVPAHFLPALAGWLLGYPVVYWPRTSAAARGAAHNCLGQVPLAVTSLRYRAPSGAETTVLQYSAPAALALPTGGPPACLGTAPGWVARPPVTQIVTLPAVAL